MPFIPAKEDMAPENVMELCRENLRESLKNYFKGKNAANRLEEAVRVATNSIGHMLTMRPVRKDPLGATIMTERASAVKKRGSTPRNM
jgi:hypothetical protein